MKEFRIVYHGKPDCTIDLALMDLIEGIGGEWLRREHDMAKNESTVWFEMEEGKINADSR